MGNEAIATRVLRYLQRHIDYFESAIVALEAARLDTPEAVEAFVHEQGEREREGSQLDAEQAALLKEWNGGTGASDVARGEVRALAGRAGELAGQLQRAYDRASLLAEGTSAAVAVQANTAKRGAGLARKFGNESPEDAGGFMDRQA